ncbi:hypothetical protein DMA11_11985 [Marinilabiliaceae bacterium JC017]|nr:hypothetical protein DMA11_11985 [Marinilabiliaceae bacterium JC017]
MNSVTQRLSYNKFIFTQQIRKGHDVGKRAGTSNKRAGVSATKMNARIPACGSVKIHQGGGQKRLFD